jgi:hypothetical protein
MFKRSGIEERKNKKYTTKNTAKEKSITGPCESKEKPLRKWQL